MALDYGSYLLSSSPPGFEFIRLKNFEFSSVVNDFPRCKSKYLEVSGFKSDVNTVFQFDNPFNKENCIKEVDSEPGKTPRWENIELVDDRTKAPNWKLFEQSRIAEWEHVYSCDPESCVCGAKKLSEKARHKNVTFADDLGQTLAKVHVMRGSSDVPPELTAEVLRQLDSCLSSDSAFVDSDNSIVRLSINFPQPAANYSVFREKLERNSVSLENVIVKDMQLFGTIKVPKHSHDKRVFVRCTFDGWESYKDHAGVYSNSNNSYYDTFSFQIDVPSDLSPRKSIQFAICFDSENVQFWDNNDGKNYEITCNHRSPKDKILGDSLSPGAFALDRKDSWSNYTGWSDEHSDPYW